MCAVEQLALHPPCSTVLSSVPLTECGGGNQNIKPLPMSRHYACKAALKKGPLGKVAVSPGEFKKNSERGKEGRAIRDGSQHGDC